MSGPQIPNDTPVQGVADLTAHLAAGSKPAGQWRIGTEHEKFAFRRSDLSPPPHEGADGIGAILAGLTRFGWAEIREGEALIGLARDGASVSLEPGGQLELSGAPLRSIHDTCSEVSRHLAEVRQVCDPLGLGMLGLGFHPTATRADMPFMPKARYRIMRDYMPRRGGLGLDMMTRTCTVQVNLDFASEADMVKKLRVGLALQPVATALFANSPFTEGRPNGHVSWRAAIWNDTDPDRTGNLPIAFEDGFGFERYVDHALDVPMYFIQREGRLIDASGQSFRDFLDGKLPALPGQRPTIGDWDAHLTTLFPDVRLKRFLEMRGADGAPWGVLCALPAFWVGLLYDGAALDAAHDLIKGWSQAERDALRAAVPRQGLDAPAPGGGRLADLALHCLAIARAGLAARAARDGFGQDETHFLDPLDEIAQSGQSPAARLLEAFHGPWNGDISRLFAEKSY